MLVIQDSPHNHMAPAIAEQLLRITQSMQVAHVLLDDFIARFGWHLQKGSFVRDKCEFEKTQGYGS
jgi:hypothetical protein